MDAKSFLLDLDGCVWFGDEPAPGAAALVADLRERGVGVGFLTNTSSSGAAALAEKLGRFGIPARAADVLTPLDVLAEHPAVRAGRRALVIGSDDVRAVLAAHGAELVHLAERRPDAVVVGKDEGLDYRRLVEATQALCDGAALVALNLDPNVPAAGGRTLPGVGAIVAALVTASGARAELVGKPSRTYFEHALKRFGMRPESTVMVGDRLDSDIAGGHRAGLRTVLVGGATGDAVNGGAADAERPDLRVASLAELHDLLRDVTPGGPRR